MTTLNRVVPRHALRLTWGRWSVRAAAFSYLIVLLLVPLAVIMVEGLRSGDALVRVITNPIARHAIWLTLWTAALMTVINAIMGTLTAFVLVRYDFWGKALLNAVVDLPFAIPTLVTGVMLVVLYGPQAVLGSWLKRNVGFDVIFAPPGILLALLFTAFPFVVRSIQPVLLNLDRVQEEAAATLGASRWTIFRRVTLPALMPAMIAGSLLSFARAIGEFGAIVVVAGNIPLRSQTAAVYIYGEVEAGNQRIASAMAVIMLAIAFGTIMVVEWLTRRRTTI